ncbi:MAG: protein serine/threonine phosphatase [Chloroflexi bacterium]|jgi:protein phosphatase|nr:protein serine/threonine phosphatase [Chloroflexota bacterium]
MIEETSGGCSPAIGPTALWIDIAGITDRGAVRSENQDRWRETRLSRAVLVVVADGMGGHAAGAEAATCAVNAVVEVVTSAADPHAALAEAFRAAGRAVREMPSGDARSGTTLLAAIVSPGRTTVANVGDSRAYLLRRGIARQITRDHSWVATEVSAGRLEAGQAVTHPARSRLVRAITGGADADVDVFTPSLGPGDVLVLCTDGIWEVLDGTALAALFAQPGSLAQQVENVCHSALAAGSRDNATVVACRPGETR